VAPGVYGQHQTLGPSSATPFAPAVQTPPPAGLASSFQALKISSVPSPVAVAATPAAASATPWVEPWQVTDPNTELPTRELTSVLNYIFDKLDQEQMPKNTGLCEMPKMQKVIDYCKVNFRSDDIFSKFGSGKDAELLNIFFYRIGMEHILVPQHVETVVSPLNHAAESVAPREVVPSTLAGNPGPGPRAWRPVLTRRGFHQWMYYIIYSVTGFNVSLCAQIVAGSGYIKMITDCIRAGTRTPIPRLDKYEIGLHDGTQRLVRVRCSAVADELRIFLQPKDVPVPAIISQPQPANAGVPLMPSQPANPIAMTPAMGATAGALPPDGTAPLMSASSQTQAVSAATAAQVNAETQAAQDLNQALFEANLARMQMNATSQMGSMLANSTGNTVYRYI
jgi:hypothetical protein